MIWISLCGKHLNLESSGSNHLVQNQPFPLVCCDIVSNLFETHFSHQTGLYSQPPPKINERIIQNDVRKSPLRAAKCYAIGFMINNNRHFLFGGAPFHCKMNFTKWISLGPVPAFCSWRMWCAWVHGSWKMYSNCKNNLQVYRFQNFSKKNPSCSLQISS